MSEEQVKNHATFIWSVADLLRGDYKQSEYGKVILPLTVIRRLDCVLEPTKAAVLEAYERHSQRIEDEANLAPFLRAAAGGAAFYNVSPFTLARLLGDPPNLATNLSRYIRAFSADARDTLEKFDFDTQIARLDRSGLLYKVLAKFTEIDLHPDAVTNQEMGYLYEELIRRFSELSNETAGEHFTPREVIRLMVDLLFITDDDTLARRAAIKTLLDPACGTGGMLSVAEEHLRDLNPDATLQVFGQELNAETFAICRSDMMLKGQDAGNIKFGNSFSEDGHAGATFDYLLANPPFGVEWKKVEEPVRAEAATRGFAGRFGAGLPRINDGSFLFLQHMISKMKPVAQGGSRLAIVFNGSPLFTGAAGSGESEIRRWIIENDWLEAVVALPDQLFYNTGISTYFWVLTNRKAPNRRGKVQLIDARELFGKMRKSLGEKRKQISDEQREEIVRLYGEFTEGDRVKILPNESFGFMRITVERPLRIRHEITEATLAAVAAAKPLTKLDGDDRERLVETLRATTVGNVDGVLKDAGLTAAQKKAVWIALAVRDAEADAVTDRRGDPEADPELRDAENVPLQAGALGFEADPSDRLASRVYREAVDDYVRREVLPFVPDAWIDHSKTKIGYEIPFTRHFYRYVPPRPLEEIDAEIKALEEEIRGLLAEVTD
ncbi:MAG: N-6 DNA methylase [Thermoleophilia bacterium]